METVLPVALQPYFLMIKGAVIAVLIFIIGWMAAKIISGMVTSTLRKRGVDESLARFLGSIARFTVLAATVIAALGAVGIETTSLVAVFASAGLAIGLALQGSLANFAAGVMILFFKPFALKELVTAGGHTGHVQDIGLFCTVLITLDNETIIIPNSKVTGGSIVNLSTRGTMRGHVDVGVAYGSDVKQVSELLLKAAARADLVLDDPAPDLGFINLGASSLDFRVFGWAKPDDFIPMHGSLRQAIYDDLNAAGIEIPYQQVVLHNAPTA